VPTPYLIADSAAQAIAFYVRVFDATERLRLTTPDGRVAHAELLVGGEPVMLADEFPEQGYVSPIRLGGSAVSIYLRVPDVDAVHARALASGARERMAPADQFDGDRRSTITDPFGHVWLIATRQEAVASEEVVRRFQQLTASEGGAQ
jgi:PhnB protein